MPLAETALLGAIAGFTIFLGLPLARMERVGPRTRVALAMLSVGILAFLFVEVMQHGFTIVEEPVEELGKGQGDLGEAIGYALMFGIGLFAGLVGLTHFERRWGRRIAHALPPLPGGPAEALASPHREALAPFELASPRAQAPRAGLGVAGAVRLPARPA